MLYALFARMSDVDASPIEVTDRGDADLDFLFMMFVGGAHIIEDRRWKLNRSRS